MCGWCVFQWSVAVVPLSRRVPGVGVCVCVLVCSGVGWLVSGVGGAKVCVVGLVCVSWFRMLMCVPLSVFFVLLSWFCLFVLLITLPGRVGLVWCVGCVVRGGVVLCGACFGFVWLLGCCLCCWWVCVFVRGVSVRRVCWCGWLFGCGVCCSGWRVARVVGWCCCWWWCGCFV